MFIKLTRLDGKPIWFNRNYIVTVEPRKESGSLVVPLGDGLDYEVVETAERIVKLLGGGTVVAAELSPEVPGPTVTDEETELQGKKTAARKDAGRTAKKTAKGKSVAAADAENAVKPAIGKKTAAKPSAKKSVKLPPIPLSEEQIVRLRRMSPGSLKKLVNTLTSQFGVSKPEKTVDALLSLKIISVSSQGHVDWTSGISSADKP